MTDLDDLITVLDFEQRAATLLPPGVHGFYAGGAGDEITLVENREAFMRWQFRPRMLVDVSTCTTRTTVLGEEISMPVVIAPFSVPHLAHPEGVRGIARAATKAGTLHCISSLADASPREVREAAPDGRFLFQAYWYGRDTGLTKALLELAGEAGFKAIVLTVDAPRLSRRERDIRNRWSPPADMVVPSLNEATGGRLKYPGDLVAQLSDTMTWKDMEDIVEWSPLPVVAKGILTAEDAVLAAEHGAVGVVVSNHGGRQMDEVAASIDALPEVAEAVGDRLEVLLDSGIRRGSDVVKALALGAKAVMIGRPTLWGLACGGQQGVEKVLGALQVEIDMALALLGVTSPSQVGPRHLQRTPR